MIHESAKKSHEHRTQTWYQSTIVSGTLEIRVIAVEKGVVTFGFVGLETLRLDDDGASEVLVPQGGDADQTISSVGFGDVDSR